MPRLALRFLWCALLLNCALIRAEENASAPTPDRLPWQPMFDGKTLNGWTQRGGKAKYEVVDGVVVGTTVPGKANSFLCTEKLYGNFILEVDFLVDPRLNSGVQIRSECFDHETELKDKNGAPLKNAKGEVIKVDAGRVHGYQVEIDPSNRKWTGAIYDERRRLWVIPNHTGGLDKNPAAQNAFKQGEWNHFRIEAIGPRIRTWINGVPADDLTDDLTPKGFIGLQVHQVGDDEKKLGLQVKFRNVRIQDLDSAAK
jgi:hypothetical protein